MRLFDAVAGFWGGPSVQDLARQIVQRSYAAVRESVEGRTWSMSRAEARGYVMAKAAPVIRTELAILAIRVPHLSDRNQTLVYDHASQRLVQSVLADLTRQARPTLRQAA